MTIRNKPFPSVFAALLAIGPMLLLAACDANTGEIDKNEVRIERTVEGWRNNLKSLGNEIEQLSEKAKENASEGSDELVAKLRRMRDDVAAKVERAGDASSDAWDDVKRGVEDGWKSLKTAVADAKEKLDGNG